MNRNWTGTAMVAFSIVGLMVVTGCSSPSTPNSASTSNTAVSASNSTNLAGTTTQPTTVTNTTNNSTANSIQASTSTPSLDTASKDKIASGLIERYVLSHNDLTMAQYKNDVRQIFYPGLASFIIMSARSGVDYDHVIKSHSVVLNGLNSTDPKSFTAAATLVLHFQSGETQTHHYQFMFALGSDGNWTIQSLRGA